MIHKKPKAIKRNLRNIISDMQDHSELFVKHPEKNLTRTRKISFSKILTFLFSINDDSLPKECLDFLFHSFTETFSCPHKYHGYRLIACGGSDLAIAYTIH